MLFLYCFLMVMPIIMMILGLIFKNGGPDNIDAFYGYRTAMSTKNRNTWNFAHRYFAVILRRIGSAMLFVSALLGCVGFFCNEVIQNILYIIVLTTQCAIFIAALFPVESALNRKFDKDGNRKIR